MKIAVLGPSPAALEITTQLHRLGASVRLFWPLATHPSPVVEEMRALGVVVPHPWHQVTKRFLQPGVVPAGRSRFADLFRVTYLVDPAPLLAQSKAEQPQAYENLSQDFLSSLEGQLEMFEDVDVVVDASPGVARGTLGPGGPAVGEGKLRPGTVLVADSASPREWIEGAHEAALVGSGAMAAQALVELRPWIEGDPGRRLFVVTAQADPFREDMTPDLVDFLADQEARQTRALEEHARAEAEWRELDDFIKAKKPRPERPIPQVVFFSGHVISAADQLIDKTRTFLTCETIPFAPGEKHPENNALELKTIGVDKLVVASGRRRPWERFPGLDLQASPDQKDARAEDGTHAETGFFTLGAAENPARREAILARLQTLFTRTEA